ncbi:protein of unknown function [Candidatus Nitrospira inopinata]|uniref:Uncharacterized protein n=1 Tax=Candidatus Nitrospira inopinata TaxID=1715989 RepID=A0A0S4KPQ2_9BACT|nr:protein of unknown function [Candidatus Nitrospira inopinata]
MSEPTADDVGDLGHQVSYLFPFIRQQIALELGMDAPLGVNMRSCSAHENVEKFYLSRGRIGSAVIGVIVIRPAWSRGGTCHGKASEVNRIVSNHTAIRLLIACPSRH